MFFKDASYTEAYYASIGLNCPSPFNCTWDEFATLGLCYRIAELGETHWQTDCQEDDDSGCSYDIHGITQFEITANFIFESKEVSPIISQQWFNISNPLLTLVSLKRHNLDTVEYKLLNITVASFYPCVYTTSNNVVNGVYSFHLLDSWRNESAAVTDNSLAANLPDVYMAPSQDQLHLAGKPFEAATYHIPGRVADLMRTTLRAILVVRAGYNSNGSVEAAFAYKGYGNSELVAFSFLTVKGLWEKVFSSLVLGATSYMRSTGENEEFRVMGYHVNVFTVINVRWAWITLPATLFSFAILFFIVTLRTNRLLPAYKNSILPLFFLSKLREERLSKQFPIDEMEKEASSTNLKFALVKRGK